MWWIILGAVLSLGRKVLADERECLIWEIVFKIRGKHWRHTYRPPKILRFDLLRFPDLMRVLVVAPPLKGELQSPKNVKVIFLPSMGTQELNHVGDDQLPDDRTLPLPWSITCIRQTSTLYIAQIKSTGFLWLRGSVVAIGPPGPTDRGIGGSLQ